MKQIPIKDNKIIVRIRDGKLFFNTENPMPFEDLLSAFCTCMLNSMITITAQYPEEQQEECKGALYDAFNCMVSGVLEKFAPEYELRPGLTAAAILKAENEIIMSGGLKDVAPHS
jgi:hypothetical protein